MNAQEKQIEGDTSYWFSPETMIAKKLELRDLENSTNPFEFRFSNGKQFVEMWQSADTLVGVLTNYTCKLGKTYKDPDIDTFFNKVILPREDLAKIKSLLEENKIAEMPNEDEIEGWRMGFDGISYQFQFSSPEKLISNSYWTPEIYDTIPEARKVLFVVDSISSLFHLNDEYENLFKTFPRKGRFGTHDAYYRIYPKGGIDLGYLASLKMPYGLNAATYFNYLGKKKIDLSFSSDFRFDKTRNYNFNFRVGKRRIFYGKNKKMTDGIIFFGREQRVNTIDNGEKVNGIKTIYSLSFSKTSVGIGLSQILRPKREAGFQLSLSHFIKKPKLYVGGAISKFSERVDYDFYIQRYFNVYFINNNLHFRVRAFSEKFRNFSDTGLGIAILLY